MATTYTTNYNLGKQENHADKFDMDVITDNADKIDAALTGLQSGIDGKQATLTTAQLAAVNSGITSTDVEQIETNKNNILLLEQANGAKNQINIPDGTYAAGTSSFSVTNGAVTSTATDNTTHAATLVTWTLKAGTYVFYDDSSDLSAVQYRIYQQSPDTRLTPAGQNPATFTLANDTVVYLSCYTFKTGTMTTRPMLMTKAMWDAGFTDYQPYAMPNTELTTHAFSKIVFDEMIGYPAQERTYQMTKADFGNISGCGIYMIYCISWEQTPNIAIYTAGYSGGVASYSVLQKVVGNDRNISISGNTITFTTTGRVQIVALQ